MFFTIPHIPTPLASFSTSLSQGEGVDMDVALSAHISITAKHACLARLGHELGRYR